LTLGEEIEMTAASGGGKRVGYVRVSSLDQNEGRQLDGIQVDKIFTDKASGKDVKRAQLNAALDYLREGDVLIVHSMDRLARNLDDLRKIVLTLTARGVVVEFVKEQLAFTGDDCAMSQLLLSVMGAFSEFERSLIKERQREGIGLAKKAGVYKGRKPSLTPERAQQLHQRIANGEQKAALAREFGISRETLYQYAPVTR
jgi:DNA invertase Pin-like site-specific DNA recombinase